MKLYLDACVISRLSDDRQQSRIAEEAEAVERIFRKIFLAEVQWVASEALFGEIQRNPNQDKRNDALSALRHAVTLAATSPTMKRRAEALHRLGYGAFDALHLAHAEDAAVDVLLTTDDRFIGRAARNIGNPLVRVMNPVIWLKEAPHGTAGNR